MEAKKCQAQVHLGASAAWNAADMHDDMARDAQKAVSFARRSSALAKRTRSMLSDTLALAGLDASQADAVIKDYPELERNKRLLAVFQNSTVEADASKFWAPRDKFTADLKCSEGHRCFYATVPASAGRQKTPRKFYTHLCDMRFHLCDKCFEAGLWSRTSYPAAPSLFSLLEKKKAHADAVSVIAAATAAQDSDGGSAQRPEVYRFVSVAAGGGLACAEKPCTNAAVWAAPGRGCALCADHYEMLYAAPNFAKAADCKLKCTSVHCTNAAAWTALGRDLSLCDEHYKTRPVASSSVDMGKHVRGLVLRHSADVVVLLNHTKKYCRDMPADEEASIWDAWHNGQLYGAALTSDRFAVQFGLGPADEAQAVTRWLLPAWKVGREGAGFVCDDEQLRAALPADVFADVKTE